MTLKREDVGGVCPLLFTMSAYVSMERGSELIETIDLIKAIYIVDLEHVANFWNDWEGLERFITSGKIGNGQTQTYLNRVLYLIRLELGSREKTGSFVGMGHPSQSFREIVDAARTIAGERAGAPASPTSRDLLLCACFHDPQLNATLRASGLQLEKLENAVRKSSR